MMIVEVLIPCTHLMFMVLIIWHIAEKTIK